MRRDEERAELLNTFFPLVINSKTSCSQGTQLSELKDGEGEQIEAPIIQGEIVERPATPLRHSQVFGARRDPVKGTEGTGINGHQGTFKHFSAVLANHAGLS